MRKLLSAVAILVALHSGAQYKHDNVTYKTVDPADLCAMLKANPGYLLLDVRSAGEHFDTSRFAGLNIGHLKGAKNIDIRELGRRWREIEDYKQKPVFIYCSHSQRSRRASRMLADSGFTNIVNINGGLTSFYYNSLQEKNCLPSLMTTTTGYRMISPAELCKKMTASTADVIILDVRTDSMYAHTSQDPQANIYGTIRNSRHIAFDQLKDRLGDLPKDKEIILADVYGDDAAKAANLLTANGYRNVSVLLEGLQRLLYMPSADVPCKTSLYVPSSAIGIVSAADFGRVVMSKEIVVFDIRSAEEFDSRHKDAFRNIGRVQNAISVPTATIASQLEALSAYKSKQVYLYDFGGGRDAYRVADVLAKNGFEHVSVIGGGLFNLRWTAANVKGQDRLADLVTGVPEENR